MKNNDLDIINRAIEGKGKIETSKQKGRKKSKGQNVLYQKGDIFQLLTDASRNISGITLRKPRRKAFELPLFMGIKPTYHIKDNQLHIVALLGTQPCDLHRLLLILEDFENKIPTFSFLVDPLFDECKCRPNIQFASLTIGGGTWPK